MYDVIIIGAGPAGLTAAIYTGRAKLKTLVLEANTVGGNARWTDQIDNFPGFPFGINGPDLMDNFHKQAMRFGAELKMAEVKLIEAIDGGHKVITDQGEYSARAIIIAIGARGVNSRFPVNRNSWAGGFPTALPVTGPFSSRFR
ncbi:NAD(P)/FAD-dependent oxidoreductase [Syntrophomonas palmitatica]|uniref:NAD(P)/FAD-dependent oxidoreductase n=1 Tax=Syntrophomonas palmitatica TaxID=402877 RepID=UPI000ADBBA10|nr:FAD-dependent oxidoreductase [Syntrophomonas palmitatica]